MTRSSGSNPKTTIGRSSVLAHGRRYPLSDMRRLHTVCAGTAGNRGKSEKKSAAGRGRAHYGAEPKRRWAMKMTWLTAALAAGLLMGLAPADALAQDAVKAVDAESKGVFTEILRIIVKWIFPIGAAYCFLHGVIGKGVKRGEWDMAAVGAIAAIALALFPKLLASLFGLDLGSIIK